MSYSDIVIADIRLVILQALAQDADYAQNEYVIDGLLGKLGHGVSGDLLRAQLSWLHEQGLVTVDALTDVWVIKLTRRGLDIADGRAHMPGVRRPRPLL